MTNHRDYESVIKLLPAWQRDEARHTIKTALAAGWTNVWFWTGEEPVDISDIYGNSPEGKGSFINMTMFDPNWGKK